ncbi:MAG: tetratricopeptide repeat protein [Gammaproteobacteria bacterium]
MSLLMDALRRAEQEKKAREAQEGEGAGDGEATRAQAPSERAPVAGPEDITMQIEPAAVAAASRGEPVDLGFDLAPGDDSRAITRKLTGDDSSAFDLADDGTDSGPAVHDGDMSRSMSLDDLSLEPIEGIEAFEQNDEDDGGLATDETAEGIAPGFTHTLGGTTAGARARVDQTATMPSARAVEHEVDAYFERSQSMEVPRGRVNADFTLEDVAAHTVVGAQTVFEASRRPRSNRLLIAVGAVAVLIVLGIGVVALFYAQQSAGPRPLPSPAVAAGVERPPLRELPVVPLEEVPAVAAIVAPRIETTTGPDTAAAVAASDAGDAGATAPVAEAPAVEAAVEPAATASLADAAPVEPVVPAAPPTAAATAGVTASDPAPRAPAVATVAAPPAAAPVPPMPPPLADVGAGEVRIARSRQPAAVDANVQAAYDAYRTGDFETARARYGAALVDHPDQRDALLGLGAVALAANDLPEAYRRYAAVLAAHPGDAVASAALFSLTGGEGDVGAARLRLLTDQAGDNPYVHFALGTWYARQQRWGDAQQAYFEAFRRDASNADYAYNLAVSLDRMGQSRAALDYYQKALGLADAGNAAFNPAQVLERIQSLAPAATP